MSSRRSRVQPVFGWLEGHGGDYWPAELLGLCEGLQLPGMLNGRSNGRKPSRGRKQVGFNPGAVVGVELEKEHAVKASAARLAWMIRNVQRLAPQQARKWRDLADRVVDHPGRDEALELLDSGTRKNVPRKLILEGPTHADCLVECQHLLIWIDGKRHDWLSPSAKWDVSRDELARNLEAVWNLAQDSGKECCLLLCREHKPKHHEEALLAGYRAGTWSAGWPHLELAVRRKLGQRIGTVTWGRILAHWPELSEIDALANLAVDVAP